MRGGHLQVTGFERGTWIDKKLDSYGQLAGTEKGKKVRVKHIDVYPAVRGELYHQLDDSRSFRCVTVKYEDEAVLFVTDEQIGHPSS